MVGADYGWLDVKAERLGWVEKDSEEYETLQKEVHQRSAERVLAVSEGNGGIFLKAAQYMSTVNGLPAEWTETLVKAQDKATASSGDQVRALLVEEFGPQWKDLFESFEENPIAVASIAQVHRATLRTPDGPYNVAVKVQHPGLAERSRGDILVLRLLAACVSYIWPHFEFRWVLPDMEEVLAREMDFIQEGMTGMRVAHLLRDMPRVHVPEVVWNLTTRRVLTMEFIEGRPATDVSFIESVGAQPEDVAETTIRAMTRLVAVHGLCHCDPHPGNVLVAGKTTGVPTSIGGTGQSTDDWRVILLDHGMYRRVSLPFRAAYCQLWDAMITGDAPKGEAACRALGVPSPELTFELLSLILTFRPGSRQRLGARMSKADVQELKTKYEGMSRDEWQSFMQTLPRDLFFVFRQTSLLRGLNYRLGGSTRNRLLVTADAGTEGAVLSHTINADGNLVLWDAAVRALESHATARGRALELSLAQPSLFASLSHASETPHGWAGLMEKPRVPPCELWNRHPCTPSSTPDDPAAAAAATDAVSDDPRMRHTVAIARRFGIEPPKMPLADPDASVNLPVGSELAPLAALYATDSNNIRDDMVWDPVVAWALHLATASTGEPDNEDVAVPASGEDVPWRSPEATPSIWRFIGVPWVEVTLSIWNLRVRQALVDLFVSNASVGPERDAETHATDRHQSRRSLEDESNE